MISKISHAFNAYSCKYKSCFVLNEQVQNQYERDVKYIAFDRKQTTQNFSKKVKKKNKKKKMI